MKPGRNPERRIGLLILGGVLIVILAFSLFSPASDDSDPVPTSYNSGSAGAKAAYLLLQKLGVPAARWESPPADLAQLDASHTTLVLAEPDYPTENAHQAQAEIAAFLERGGHILATGRSGAYLLPGGKTGSPSLLYKALCVTTPEKAAGADPLAAVGPVSLEDSVAWEAKGADMHVAQRCGDDAVVVRLHYGAGEAIWWSSAQPLTNRGLKDDASLRLVLASLTPRPGERVLFDEYFHGTRTSLWENARGLPIAQLLWQCALVAVLLVLSFGRRNGPLRAAVTLPRTSPVEFAESMGRLYRSANATQAATDGARKRLLHFLGERCGVPRQTLRAATGAGVVEALHQRFGGDWTRIGSHLTQAAEAEYNKLRPRSALQLVRALDRDQRDLTAAASSHRTTTSQGRPRS